MGVRIVDKQKLIDLYTQGLTHAEMAEILGCKKGTLAPMISKLISEGSLKKRKTKFTRSIENLNQSKITTKDVLEIYRLRFEEQRSLKEIAATYDLDPRQIGHICRGKSWPSIYQMHREKFPGDPPKITGRVARKSYKRIKNNYENLEASVTLSKERADFYFSKKLIAEMNLKPGDGLAFLLSDTDLIIEKRPEGLEVLERNNANLKLYNTILADKVRYNFGLESDASYKFVGKVAYDKFTMEIITTVNARKGSSFTQPTINVSKYNISAFSKASQRLMGIERGDRVVLGKENGKIYVALSDSEKAFNFTFSNFGMASVSRQGFGAEIRDFFGIEKGKSFKVLLKDEPLKVEKQYFFEVEIFK